MVGCNACISSLKGVVVQNHSLSKLQKKEQLLVVPLNNVAEEDIDEQHFNTHETVPKYDVNGVSLPEGRGCMNASFSKAGESRNSGLDRGVSEIHYPAGGVDIVVLLVYLVGILDVLMLVIGLQSSLEQFHFCTI